MQTLKIVFASFLVVALGPGAARAATTTHLVESGTGAHVDASYTSPDFCIEIRRSSIRPPPSPSRTGGRAAE